MLIKYAMALFVFRKLLTMKYILTGLLICVLIGADAQSFSEITRWFIHTDEPIIALVGGDIIDGTGSDVLRDQTILIQDKKIAAIGNVDEISIPESAEMIDCRGKTIIPGLVMLHEHMFYSTPFKDKFSLGQMSWTFPRLYLAGGATTIRTAGSINPTADLNVKRMIEKGEMPGPDMDVTGPFINSGDGVSISFPQLVGENAATRMVDFWADQGCTSFKAYMQITRDDLQQIVDAAHARGLKVTGHLCSVPYKVAVDIGIDCFEHGFYMASDFDPLHKEDWCDPFGMSRALRAQPVESQKMKDLMQYLVDHGTAVTSTLPVMEPLRDDAMIAGGGFEALDEHYQLKIQKEYERRRQIPSAFDMTYFNKQRSWEKQFFDMGGLLVAGTDPTGDGTVIAGYANQHVPELFVEGGFSVEEAIRVCTLHGAIYLERDDVIGSIEVGKRADLVVIDGDLTADIRNMRRMQYVFKNGVGYDSKKLFESVRGVVGTN